MTKPETTAVAVAKNNGWQVAKFGDMAENIGDRVDNPSEAGVDRYVGLEHLDPESLKIRRWGTPDEVEATKLRFKPGDIIFGKRRAYQRKLAVADFEGICSAHAMVLRAREDTVVKEFLPVFMQSDMFFERALAISVGSLSPTINWTTLAAQEFTLPPKDEQKRIAGVMWSADAVEQCYLAALKSIDQVKASVSHDYFSTEKTQNSRNCEELGDITVGIVVTPAKYYVDEGIPALRSLNVFPDRFDLSETVMLSKEGHRLHAKSQLAVNDVVVVRTGRPGDAAVVPPELQGYNCIDLIIIRPGKQILPAFLSRFLNSIEGRKQINRGTAGTAQQHLNVSQIKKVIVPTPDIGEQWQIVEKLNHLERAWNSAQEHLSQIKVLKNSLINQALGYV